MTTKPAPNELPEAVLPELPVSPYIISEWTGPEMVDRKTWTAYTAEQMHAYAQAAILADRESRAAGDGREGDARRLDWLEANELSLATHREDCGDDEYTIWWTVVRIKKCSGDSVSGHPLGNPRDAIDTAMGAGQEGCDASA